MVMKVLASVHAAAYDAQDSKALLLTLLNCQLSTQIKTYSSRSAYLLQLPVLAIPCTQHSRSHKGQLVCPSSTDGRLLMTLAFKAFTHSKMVCYTQNHPLYSGIHHLNEDKKLLYAHTVNTFKRPKF